MKKRNGKASIGNKWARIKVLESGKLAGFVPKTRKMSRLRLRDMLNKYGMVYVKPCYGAEGRGVMKVEAAETPEKKIAFRCQAGERIVSFRSFDAAYRSILRIMGREAYMVQQGIHLLRHNGRPFDIRLMVQKNPRGLWEITGAVGRVAHPRKIVTNGSQGGTIYPVEHLLRKYAPPLKRGQWIRMMNRMGMTGIKQLHDVYPGITEIGFDIAIDNKGKPWILEANAKPDPCPFTKVKDRSMLEKIIRYGRVNGRRYVLRCTKAHRGMR